MYGGLLKHWSVKEDDKGAVQVSPDRTGAGRSRAEAMFTVNTLETWGCGRGHVDVVTDVVHVLQVLY